MRGWILVVLLCTALLCEPIQSQEKWSRPEAADKRIDDWVPITASCPSCKQNLEPTESNGADEIGSLLNPPAVPSGRAFNFNGKQNNNFIRATAGEPYEITTPPATSGQFFSQQQAPKIPQPVHFPVPFFGQQNPFQTRFQQGLPSFQPQFTFIPQPPPPQVQPLPKENKVTFPESPFIQQQNKGSVQLVYVPIEAIQRQKPRLQSDRPIPQQSQLDVKTQSPFETGKLKFQRPPQPFDPSRFPSPQQFEQEPNRFAPPPPPPPPSFNQDAGRFPPPSQLFEQEKPSFTNQLKEQRPEFLPQNEQPVAPQSYQFVEDARNPPSNFFQFHDNRFQKPSFEEQKFKESKPQIQPTFVPQTEGSRQESAQHFDGNRPRPDLQQNMPSNFPETRPRQEPPPFQQNFLETRPRQEQRPQNNQPNFQEQRPKQEQPPPPQLPPQTQFIQKFEEPKLEPQPQFIPNFQETRPRQEPPPQFVPKFEEPKLVPQQQFISNFQEIPPQVAQQTFAPNFESLRPNPEIPQNFVPNFQETRPKQESQESFTPNFEEVKFKPKPKAPLQSSTSPSFSQETFNSPISTEQIVQTTSTPYPPAHQPPLSVYMEKRLDNRINEVLTILKDSKTIPVLDTIGTRSPKVFVGPSDLNAPRGYVKFELPYLSSLDITKIDSMVDRLPFFVAPLNFKPPFGYAKIPFPPPHIGSVVVSSKSPAVATSTEFAPFALTSQLPTEVNSLQPAVSSTTQRVIEKVQPSTEATTSTPKRSRQRKPLHRGSLTSFSTTTPVNDITERQRDQFTTPAELQRLPENSPTENEHISSTPTPSRHAFTRRPVEQQAAFETTQAPVQQQQQFDNPPQQQFFSNEQIPQTQQDYLDTLPQLTQQQFFNNQQQPNQQSFFENQPQFLDNSPQTIQEQITNNPQSFVEVNNQDTNQQQFISSSTEKQIFKNFQQVQPLSQYQVNNNFLNQQPSSTEQVQSVSNTPQTVSNEPESVVTLSPPEAPKLRQRLSYYDKLLLTSTQVPAVEITSAQNTVETSEKPRERQKLRPRQRLTTTRRPTTEQSSATNEVSEHVTSETSTQRYNPLKRRRPVTTTTTTAEPVETTRSLLRSRTTQASRSEFVRSRTRRPTTTSTTTTEATRVQQYEETANNNNNNDDVQSAGVQQEEQKKIDEAASFWNEPVTAQQGHSYELDVRSSHQQAYTPDGKFSSAEPPADGDFSKEKFAGEPKKAHDPNGEKKPPGRRGHWVRVRVKKPQDGLDTAESQNSLGPLSANAIRELATKRTTEFDSSPSSPATVASSSSSAIDFEFAATSDLTTTSTTTTTQTPEQEPEPTNVASSATAGTVTTTTTTTTTTASPPTTVFDYITEGVTEERAVETTIAPPSAAPPSAKTYPDDEQDEAFQRNLADMLAKFIGGGNGQSQETAAPATAADESTAETQYDAEQPTVTPSGAAVTELPTAPVTSTTTKVSMETEICYKGRCVKSKKNKQITDQMSEP